MVLPQFSNYDISQQVLEFMRNNDCSPDGNISLTLDGQIHRYKLIDDKHGRKSGAYCIWTDNLPAGWIKNWHNRFSLNWHYDISDLPQEIRSHFDDPEVKRKAEEEQKKREQLLKERQLKAADNARIRINTLPEADENHKYLQDKHIYPYGIKLDGESLAVPLRDITGEIKSLQWITPEGNKKFYPNAPTTGLFWSIGLDLIDENPDIPILLGEGFATMAKVYELTGFPCVAGFSCYYYKTIAQALHSVYSDSKIIVMADNDKATELKRSFNPGIEHAKELVNAHLAHGIVFPEFEHPNDGSDWDDYAILFGDENTAELLAKKIKWESMSEQEKHEYNTRKSLSGIIHDLDCTVQLPPQEFVGGLFPRKFVSLLIAPPGTGKTIFMQKFVSDLSIGGSIFDGFTEDEPPRVSLILAGEAGYELLVRRGASMKWQNNPRNIKVLDQYEWEYL